MGISPKEVPQDRFKIIGRNLSFERFRKGLTQAQLAELAGIADSRTVSKHEHGEPMEMISQTGLTVRIRTQFSGTMVMSDFQAETIRDGCIVIDLTEGTFVSELITDPSMEALSDKSSGIRSCKDIKLADKLIRNTYKTLMSRGQKGCYLYCEDKALLEYIGRMLKTKIEG